MTQVTQTTSVDYSQDRLYEHFKKNKLIHKQDSEINPFAQVPLAATDATSSQHLFVLFLNACLRGMILSAALHISIIHSTYLQTTIPATCHHYPLLSTYTSYDTSIPQSKIPPMFSPPSSPAFISKYLCGHSHPSDQHCLSPSKAKHTIRKCFAHYQRYTYLISGPSRTINIYFGTLFG